MPASDVCMYKRWFLDVKISVVRRISTFTTVLMLFHLNIPQCVSPTKPQRSMDEETKMVMLCLLVAGTQRVTSLFPISFLHTPYLMKKSMEETPRSHFFLWHCHDCLSALSSPALSEEWKATVVQNLEALVSSCVVVPCSFSHPKENLPSSRLRGIWHRSKKWDERIYYYDNTKVLDNFRGRTRMLGYLGQNNCTLEITDIKDHDNGPFCFRIELARTEADQPTKDMFSFVESCFELTMLRMSSTSQHFINQYQLYVATIASYFISVFFSL